MKKRTLIQVIAALALVLAILISVAVLTAPKTTQDPPNTTLSSKPTESQKPTEPTFITEPTEPSTAPPVIKEATATVSSVGDILMHGSVYESGYDRATGTYDLDLIFKYFSDYVTSADMALANLETTLAGPDRVYYDSNGNRKVGYSGYPNFNCPDAIGTALKNAGFDNILTANNHSYDTGHTGFLRTQQILREQGLQWMGTRLDQEQERYVIAELNGIRIGMLCYTYATPDDYPEVFSLNGILMEPGDSGLINAFDYNRLPVFYEEVRESLDAMEAQGVDATMMFIHWGEEYVLGTVDSQKTVAQGLCDLGIDVIVGGHPHVVEPMELLTSTVDESHKTVCLYSMGNAVSNQRRELISRCPTGHTEDGVMFSVTFAKYSDGTVIVEAAEILPFWVDMRRNAQYIREYYILPLDRQIEDWKTQFDLTEETLRKAEESYERTMAIVGQGLTEINEYCSANQAAVEAALGVR